MTVYMNKSLCDIILLFTYENQKYCKETAHTSWSLELCVCDIVCYPHFYVNELKIVI